MKSFSYLFPWRKIGNSLVSSPRPCNLLQSPSSTRKRNDSQGLPYFNYFCTPTQRIPQTFDGCVLLLVSFSFVPPRLSSWFLGRLIGWHRCFTSRGETNVANFITVLYRQSHGKRCFALRINIDSSASDPLVWSSVNVAWGMKIYFPGFHSKFVCRRSRHSRIIASRYMIHRSLHMSYFMVDLQELRTRFRLPAWKTSQTCYLRNRLPVGRISRK